MTTPNTKTNSIDKTLNIGKLGNSPIVLELEMEHKGPEYTTTNEVITKRTTEGDVITEYDTLSITGHGGGQWGQIHDTIRKHIDEMQLNIPREDVIRILDIWQAHHLNDMSPSCIHQQKDDWGKTEITITQYQPSRDVVYKLRAQVIADAKEKFGVTLDVNDGFQLGKATSYSHAARILALFCEFNLQPFTWTTVNPADFRRASRKVSGYDSLSRKAIEQRTETKTTGWLRPSEHPQGVLDKPCPVCGYKYGSAWLVSVLPAAIKTEILALFDRETPEPVTQLQQFITDHGITLTAHRVDTRPDRSKDDELSKDARHWRCHIFAPSDPVTVTRNQKQYTRRVTKTMGLYFSHGSAHTEEPTLIEVLECLQSDFSSYENADGFEDWARDLGLEPDSRKAERIYKTVKRQAEQLRRVLGPDTFDEFLKVEVSQ